MSTLETLLSSARTAFRYTKAAALSLPAMASLTAAANDVVFTDTFDNVENTRMPEFRFVDSTNAPYRNTILLYGHFVNPQFDAKGNTNLFEGNWYFLHANPVPGVNRSPNKMYDMCNFFGSTWIFDGPVEFHADSFPNGLNAWWPLQREIWPNYNDINHDQMSSFLKTTQMTPNNLGPDWTYTDIHVSDGTTNNTLVATNDLLYGYFRFNETLTVTGMNPLNFRVGLLDPMDKLANVQAYIGERSLSWATTPGHSIDFTIDPRTLGQGPNWLTIVTERPYTLGSYNIVSQNPDAANMPQENLVSIADDFGFSDSSHRQARTIALVNQSPIFANFPQYTFPKELPVDGVYNGSIHIGDSNTNHSYQLKITSPQGDNAISMQLHPDSKGNVSWSLSVPEMVGQLNVTRPYVPHIEGLSAGVIPEFLHELPEYLIEGMIHLYLHELQASVENAFELELPAYDGIPTPPLLWKLNVNGMPVCIGSGQHAPMRLDHILTWRPSGHLANDLWNITANQIQNDYYFGWSQDPTGTDREPKMEPHWIARQDATQGTIDQLVNVLKHGNTAQGHKGIGPISYAGAGGPVVIFVSNDPNSQTGGYAFMSVLDVGLALTKDKQKPYGVTMITPLSALTRNWIWAHGVNIAPGQEQGSASPQWFLGTIESAATGDHMTYQYENAVWVWSMTTPKGASIATAAAVQPWVDFVPFMGGNPWCTYGAGKQYLRMAKSGDNSSNATTNTPTGSAADRSTNSWMQAWNTYAVPSEVRLGKEDPHSKYSPFIATGLVPFTDENGKERWVQAYETALSQYSHSVESFRLGVSTNRLDKGELYQRLRADMTNQVRFGPGTKR